MHSESNNVEIMMGTETDNIINELFESYIDSPGWIKNKKATINPQNKNNECFRYAITVALNYKEIKKTLKEYQKLSLLLINIIGRI